MICKILVFVRSLAIIAALIGIIMVFYGIISSEYKYAAFAGAYFLLLNFINVSSLVKMRESHNREILASAEIIVSLQDAIKELQNGITK